MLVIPLKIEHLLYFPNPYDMTQHMAQPLTKEEYLKETDENLMLLYQKGDDKAFECLLGRHQAGVYNYLYRFMGPGQSVEEAFQEVFFRVIRSSPKYLPQAKFSTWLYTIVRNYCVDELRKKKNRKVSMLEDQVGESETSNWEDRFGDDAQTQEDTLYAMSISQKLEEGLSRINTDQREVFILREKMGLPFDEIAQIVGASVNTVKSRMRYAIMQLRETFKDFDLTSK